MLHAVLITCTANMYLVACSKLRKASHSQVCFAPPYCGLSCANRGSAGSFVFSQVVEKAGARTMIKTTRSCLLGRLVQNSERRFLEGQEEIVMSDLFSIRNCCSI